MQDFVHRPVMLTEVMQALGPHPGASYVDATVGGAGHAEAILAASSPTGRLYGFDRDGDAVEAAQRRLSRYAGRFEIRQGNFADLLGTVPAGAIDGVLMDLGVSSPQLDRPERGFSFLNDGPLDMRMDQKSGEPAARLVNELGVEELAAIFWKYGGERESRKIARAIERERKSRPIESTQQLAGLVERILPRGGRKTHPATRIFQALRIAVNDEMGALETGLNAALEAVKPGGRITVITFHSLEDRLVKDFGRRLSRDYEAMSNVDIPELRQPCAPKLRLITRKAIQPGEAEVRENPRSRSAQLRVFEKI